ncbi:hypothetical protein ACQI5H_20155 [Mycobacterium heidelbergense]|uniref:hypothetical protein n=1 Tax=Mycobacterium heidelbergense TaxID=53376 RepID=UPI003CEA7765
MTTPSNTDLSAGNLTTQMQQLTQFGAGKDLQISEGARKTYTDAIRTYRQHLSDLRDKAAGLVHYQAVGGFVSAQNTMAHQKDNTATWVAHMDDCISHLHEAENAVNAACKRQIAQDQSH